MIRTKAKSLLLSIMLVLACFVFFACKEEERVEVESIAFTETNISLLVGDEYVPEVKVLPSYASDRSYTLVSSDSTVLKIDAGTITALRPAKDVKLKVVSNDNANVNDIISITIYEESVQLEAPTEPKFDDKMFTFVGKDNAEAYVLKVNGYEINIGNNTEYLFDNVVSKLGSDLTDTVVNWSVKSVGDDRVFTNSQFIEGSPFVKLSQVTNAYVENEKLYFDAIENVASYTIDVVGVSASQPKIVNNDSFKLGALSIDISDLTDSLNGAEYTLKITPNVQGYNTNQKLDVFVGESTTLNYATLGVVKNVKINEKVISWDFVKNAKTYALEIYKDGSLVQQQGDIVNNYYQISFDDAGEYNCKVLAKSTDINVTTGKVYSEPLNFVILPAPEVVVDNNSVSWAEVENAEGYLVTIKNDSGTILTNKKFVLQAVYDISNFSAGTYQIEVIACGNGQDGQTQPAILASKISTLKDWKILQSVQLGIANETLYWVDNDVNSLNKYRLQFDGNDITLTSSDYSEQYKYNASTNTFSYDLSNYNFEPNTYAISLQSVGEDNVFDAKVNNTSIIKLAKSSIVSLSNKQFTVNHVENAANYRVEVYEASNLDDAIITLSNMFGGYKFNLDTNLLSDGNYVAKVFVTGNQSNIFDADNSNVGTTLNFEKLAIPSISVDAGNNKLIIDESDSVKNEKNYKLFENGSNKSIVGNEYSLNNLTAGDYVYTAQAVGDNGTILDSDITATENKVTVKKLAQPTISFDKQTCIFTISSEFENDEYTFAIKGENDATETPISVVNNKADCSGIIDVAQDYKITVYVNSKTMAGYNLVIKSEPKTYSVSKLDGGTTLEIADGNLIVTPDVDLVVGGYSLTLTIENGEGDIVLQGFNFTNSRFEKQLYDNKYNVKISEIESILSSAGQYDIYTTISKNDKDVVTSDLKKSTSVIKVLGKVNSINKNAEAIEFNAVENATNYIAVIELENREYYIDIAEKYSAGSKNVLQIQDLLQLMELNGIAYKEQTAYKISFVAVNEDNTTIPNKGTEKFEFEFLKRPTLSVVEQNGANTKYLAISNDEENAYTYNVVVGQSEVVKNENVTKSTGDSTLINMDTIALVDGNVKVEVCSYANSGNYFASKVAELNVTKISSLDIEIIDGLLVWNALDSAKQYNLVYENHEKSDTVVLTEGTTNFEIKDGKCIYNFDQLESIKTSMYIQVDSIPYMGGQYYLNSNKGTTYDNIYKLPTPQIKVNEGKVYIEIRRTDFDLIDNAEFKVDGVDKEINILETGNGVYVDKGENVVGITIYPSSILAYGTTSMIEEKIELKYYAKEGSTLNSSATSKDVCGLLSPTGLDITTSNQTDENGVVIQVFEKITWDTPTVDAGSEYIDEYEIVVNYNGKDYSFTATSPVFSMPTCGVDSDGNETEFVDGTYTIKVRALTNNCESILNSKYCSPITVTILATPTGLGVENGNIIWQYDENAGYYLVKIYLLTKNNQQLIASTQSNTNEIDLTKLNPLTEGVYGVSIQALHNASRILSSKESEILQVIRLPQVAEYYIKDGELYIRVHKFFNKMQVSLTDKSTQTTVRAFDIEQGTTSKENISKFIEQQSIANLSLVTEWSKSAVISTFTDESYFVDVKCEKDGDSTLPVNVANYKVNVKLFGNSITLNDMNSVHEGANIGAIISGHVSQPNNIYFEEEITDKNSVEKLQTPIVEVSTTERGVVNLSVPEGEKYSLSYYMTNDKTKSLQGVHLYEIDILTDNPYKLYIAEIVNSQNFEASLTAVGGALIQDDEDRNNLKHFEYGGKTFNVIDKGANGCVSFDFNTNRYYYYQVDGTYSYIELSAGGSFVVSARFLGDDSIFVNSNVSNLATIDRYNSISLDVNNGAVSWANQATVNNHPMYLITLSNNVETYNIVLYNPNIEYAPGQKYTPEYLSNCLEKDKTYIFDTITYSLDENIVDEVIVYNGLADIIEKDRISKGSNLVGMGGTFNSSIKAYYTDSTSMNTILAQGGDSKTVSIIPNSAIGVSSGVLTWNMSYISTTGGQEYIKNYLLQVFEDENKLYEITLNEGNYSENNNVATYELARKLNNGTDGEFVFETDKNYTFKLIALAGEGKTYVNSVATSIEGIEILPDLQNIRMEEGKVKWDNPTGNKVEVVITYNIGSATITIEDEYVDNFVLPIKDTDDSGTLRELIAGYDYNITLRIKGTSSSINGFFSYIKAYDEYNSSIQYYQFNNIEYVSVMPSTEDIENWNTAKENYYQDKIVAQRMKTVKTNTISTNNGVLTWEANELQGTKYSVEYTLSDGTSAQSGLLEDNMFDFAGLKEGNISAQVVAHHNNHFTSFASEKVELFKLSIPTNIIYHADSTTISWDPVQDKNGNDVTNYKVKILKEGYADREYICTSNQWRVENGVSGDFGIAVKAISVEENGYIISSDYSLPIVMTTPNQVDATTFEFDEDIQAFKWKPIEGEQAGDEYYISFTYYKTIFNGSIEGVTADSNENIKVTEKVNGYYYYYPYKVGSYRSINVQVKRAGSLSSPYTYCLNEDGSFYELNFELFKEGYGTSGNPYIITSETHFRNVKYFLNAFYQIESDIQLSNNLPITDETIVFEGSINGNNKYIYGFVDNTEKPLFRNSGYVGLFNKTNNAIFSNINLTAFNVKGYVNSSELYLGTLVSYASNTTFNNIKITSSEFEINKSTSYGYVDNAVAIYAGAIVGYSVNSNFTNCEISMVEIDSATSNVNINITGTNATQLCFGGIVGYANGGEFDSNFTAEQKSAFIVSQSNSGTPNVYIGGIIGCAKDVYLTNNDVGYMTDIGVVIY